MKLRLLNHRESILSLVGATLFLAALAACIGAHRYGSVSNTLAALNGEIMVVRPPVQRLGTLSVGNSRSLTYSVTNLSNRPIVILGARASCKCTKIATEMTALPARETVAVNIIYNPILEQAGRDYNGKVKLYVDEPSVRQIELAFQARVIAPPR